MYGDVTGSLCAGIGSTCSPTWNYSVSPQTEAVVQRQREGLLGRAAWGENPIDADSIETVHMSRVHRGEVLGVAQQGNEQGGAKARCALANVARFLFRAHRAGHIEVCPRFAADKFA